MPWLCRALRLRRLRLRGASCVASIHKTDDLGVGSRSGSTASCFFCRPCSLSLAATIDESVKVLLGEPDARSLSSATDIDVGKRTILDEGGYLIVGDAEIRRRL